MKVKPLTLAAMTAAFATTTPATFADVVTDWNKITLEATKTAGLNSNLGSRIDAIEAIAVYDAVNSIKQVGKPYHYYDPAKGGASVEAAAAQAAHDVLVHYFPAQASDLDEKLATSLAAIPEGPAKEDGKTTGSAAASDIIILRANDGSSPNVVYPGPVSPGIGEWRPAPGPTPGSFPPGINEQWGDVTPFVLPVGDIFRPKAPPEVGSREYQKALAEVKSLGAIASATRSVEQTHIAQFYKQDAELLVNEAARLLASEYKLPPEASAVLFLLTDLAVADARIAAWEAKYTYKFWRPVTALNADGDGAVRNNYAAWTPFLVTPSHPSYPSGHSATVNAGVDVLKAFFGNGRALTLHTTTPGEPPRTVRHLNQIEEENGLSRIYGGIHYSFDNLEGQKLGQRVAGRVLREFVGADSEGENAEEGERTEP